MDIKESAKAQVVRIRLVAAATALAVTLAPIAAQAHPGGWGGWHPYREHHDRGPDAGSVIAGLLVIGAIAAVATSVANRDRQARAQASPPPYPPDASQPQWKEPSWQDRDPRWDAVPPPPSAGAYGWTPGAHDRALDQAVEACADRARSRGGLDQIWDAARQGDGYRVRGNLGTGNSFVCNVDGSGRVTDLSVLARDGGSTSGPGAYGSDGYGRPTATGMGADDGRDGLAPRWSD